VNNREPCKKRLFFLVKISDLYPENQCRAEIIWLEKEVERVREEMKKRSSKIKHLRDLERQIQERRNILPANKN
jgi:hypothetical protein